MLFFSHLTITTVLGILSTLAWAQGVPGPYAAAEAVKDSERQGRRYAVGLLAPIPAQVLGGLLVAKGDFFSEEMLVDAKSSLHAATSTAANQYQIAGTTVNRPLESVGLGALYLPHAKEGAPRLFLMAQRYGAGAFNKPVRPMVEFIVGADIDEEDMPAAWRLRFSATDETSTRFFLRWRRFPGFNRWLFGFGHRVHTASGLGIDVQFPSHALISWHTPDADATWKFYGGSRWQSREYPFVTSSGAHGWVDGYATSLLLGLRRHLVASLYGVCEGGMQNETRRFVDEGGVELASYQTKFAPFVRLAIETWIKLP